jgi:hypothetical protein
VHALVDALAPEGFAPEDVRVLAARDPDLLVRSPRSVVAGVLAFTRFFHPHSLKLVADKDLPRSLAHHEGRKTTRAQYALLTGHQCLHWTYGGLSTLLARYVQLGAFPTVDAARHVCMRQPQLMKRTSWDKLVRLREGVLATGGSIEDVRGLMKTAGLSTKNVIKVGLFRRFTGCAPGATRMC